MLIALQMGQIQQEQQLDGLQSNIDRVIEWLRRLRAADDGKGAGRPTLCRGGRSALPAVRQSAP